MDGNPPVSIIIPSDLVQKFTEVSSRNLCSRDGKHVETLAFAIGSEENNHLTVRHLIFPRQTSLPASVEDKGKNDCLFVGSTSAMYRESTKFLRQVQNVQASKYLPWVGP